MTVCTKILKVKGENIVKKLKKNGFLSEFKAFITRGNVLDMAVGVIVATAFTNITKSLVDKVFMPFIGWIIGDIDLTKWNITLPAKAAGSSDVVIEIGSFVAAIIDFLLIAFILFLVIKAMAKLKEIAEKKILRQVQEEAKEEAPKAPTTEELLSQILEEIKKEK